MAAISRKELEVQIARAYAAGYRKGYDEGYQDRCDACVPDKPQMYTEYVLTSDNESIPRAYRFGREWVGTQLFMEGGYATEDDAYIAWHKEMMKDDPEH